MGASLFSEEDKKAIVASVKAAEMNTSGEIQVHIEKHCKPDVLDRAAEVFAILKMHETKMRNGVLFYLATSDKKFAILGDAGINKVVPANFWDKIKEQMQSDFKQGLFSKGLCEGIKMAGEALRTNFPYHTNDENELSDEISFGKDQL